MAFKNINLPESPVKPINTQFMMTGLTCTVTDTNRDGEMETTVKRADTNNSVLTPMHKSSVDASPKLNQRMTAMPFMGDANDMNKTAVPHALRGENMDNFKQMNKKNSDLD